VQLAQIRSTASSSQNAHLISKKKIFLKIFQKTLDKLPKVWYNINVRKREQQARKEDTNET
jgi:hypothetical protein